MRAHEDEMSDDRKFLFNYRFDGAEYGLDVLASTPEEAKRKVQAMALSRYDGEIFATIRLPLGDWIMRWFAK